ncbi:MAG TPA: polysaccharide biosynthesis/export family protein [Polyangiaceae bacterium]|jgi:polysaccharide export outer membrane protein
MAALVLAALLGCATTPTPPPERATAASYIVGAPDSLHVTILPDPTIERDVTVRPDGMISLDLIGDVPAAGRSVGQIASDVEQRISRFKRGAAVTVSLVTAASNSISVLGEVRSPQSFALLKQTRVAEAIARVGGPVFTGSEGRIRVVRSGGGEAVVYRVNLNAIQSGDQRTNIVLAEGDIVYVPPTWWAQIGYVVQAILFPFNPLLGLGTTVAGVAVSP